MGNARVIFVGAVSVILGLYSVGLERAERAVGRVAEVNAYQMQAEEIAKGGVAMAINKLGTEKPTTLPSQSAMAMFGGTVSYVVNDQGLGADEARIRATGIYQGHTAVREAVVKLTSTQEKKKKRWNNWEVLRVRTEFAASEFENRYTTD